MATRNRGGGKPPGELVLGIIAYLTENAEATRTEICRAMDRNRFDIGSVMTRMNKALPNRPKRIYVIRWIYEDDGARRYPRPVYALGDLPDAKKPKASAAANSRLHYERNRNFANSVWQWATPPRRRIGAHT